MSKLLIIGDLHGKKSSLEVFAEVLDKSAKLASKCDLTILMGDVNDTKANIRSEVLRILIDKLKSWPTRVIILIGNHDYDNAIECKGHSLEVLSMLDNVEIVSQPLKYENMFFVPYLPEDRFLQVKLEKTDLLFLHQDMQSAKYSNQQEVNSKISPDLFKKYKRVFVGHIHKAQEFKNIIYVGTPYTESFKESDEVKRVIVYDTDTDKILSVPLGVRQHVTHEYTIAELKDIKDIKEDLKAKIKKNQIVRLIVNVPEDIESKIKKSLFEGLNITQIKTKKISASKQVKLKESMTNVELMNIYLGQLELTDTQKQDIAKWNATILDELV